MVTINEAEPNLHPLTASGDSTIEVLFKEARRRARRRRFRMLAAALVVLFAVGTAALKSMSTPGSSPTTPREVPSLLNSRDVVSVVPNTTGYGDVVTDSAGNAYVAYTTTGVVTEITASGKSIPFVSASQLHGAGPWAMCVDGANNLFIAGYDNGEIYKVTPAKVISVYSTGSREIYAMAIDRDGNLFVSGGNGTISEIRPTLVTSVFATHAGGNGLTFDTKGNLYSSSDNGNIYKITPRGVVSTFATGLAQPNELAYDATSGVLYAAQYGGSPRPAVVAVSPTGVVTSAIPNEAFHHVSGWLDDSIGGIALDRAGNLYINSWSSKLVFKVARAAARTTKV